MLHLPLPDEDKSYLRSFSGIFRDRDEAERYLYDSWERIQVVLQLLENLHSKGVRKVLELGANPYYLTLLIQKYFDFDLSLANFFGDAALDGEQDHTVERNGQKQQIRYRHFNVERDPFPHADDTFDCVIFCEIIEHLLVSADVPMAEIRRVLRPGGFVIVSTPNATRLGNLVRLLKGRNIYADYSPYGAYGRHNREYTLAEIEALMQRHALSVVETRVRNIYPHPLKSRMLQALRPTLWYEHLFVVAQKA